jgi:hypothetical protein
MAVSIKEKTYLYIFEDKGKYYKPRLAPIPETDWKMKSEDLISCLGELCFEMEFLGISQQSIKRTA